MVVLQNELTENHQKYLEMLLKQVDFTSERVGHVNQLKQKFDAKVDGLDAKVDGLDAKVGGLEAKVGGLQGDVQGIKADVQGIKGDVQGMKGLLEQLLIEAKTKKWGLHHDSDSNDMLQMTDRAALSRAAKLQEQSKISHQLPLVHASMVDLQ